MMTPEMRWVIETREVIGSLMVPRSRLTGLLLSTTGSTLVR